MYYCAHAKNHRPTSIPLQGRVHALYMYKNIVYSMHQITSSIRDALAGRRRSLSQHREITQTTPAYCHLARRSTSQ